MDCLTGPRPPGGFVAQSQPIRSPMVTMRSPRPQISASSMRLSADAFGSKFAHREIRTAGFVIACSQNRRPARSPTAQRSGCVNCRSICRRWCAPCQWTTICPVRSGAERLEVDLPVAADPRRTEIDLYSLTASRWRGPDRSSPTTGSERPPSSFSDWLPQKGGDFENDSRHFASTTLPSGRHSSTDWAAH